MLKTVLWNAKCLAQHWLEKKHFATNRNIDVMLILETFFKKDSYFKIPSCTFSTPIIPVENPTGVTQLSFTIK